MQLSETILVLREQLALTRHAFAKKAGCSPSSIAHYGTAKRSPGAFTIARLCRLALEANRPDLADAFAAALPGVPDGLLVPSWKLPATVWLPVVEDTSAKRRTDPTSWSWQGRL